ncbi:MAG: DUF2240 family protein [Thermoplasmatota archaeon]
MKATGEGEGPADAGRGDELRSAVALIFRRKAKDVLTDREFVFSASMDLRWFNYSDAMKLLEAALEKGLLRRDGRAVRPTFDHRALELPAAFRPSPGLLRAAPKPPGSLLMRAVDMVAARTGRDAPAVLAAVNRRRAELGVEPEVAALLLAREEGVDIAPLLDEAERVVRDRAASRTGGDSGERRRDEEE